MISDERAQIKSIGLKKHRYSRGETITCEIKGKEHYVETIFEKSFLYDMISTLSEGDFILASGFIEDSCLILTSVKTE